MAMPLWMYYIVDFEDSFIVCGPGVRGLGVITSEPKVQTLHTEMPRVQPRLGNASVKFPSHIVFASTCKTIL
jgi:hypothetical protein